jgi:hypothetical protein
VSDDAIPRVKVWEGWLSILKAANYSGMPFLALYRSKYDGAVEAREVDGPIGRDLEVRVIDEEKLQEAYLEAQAMHTRWMLGEFDKEDG